MGMNKKLRELKRKQPAKPTEIDVVLNGQRTTITLPVICKNRATLERLIEQLSEKKGLTINVTVLHSDDCRPGQCVCSPDYLVEDYSEEAYKRQCEAQRAFNARSLKVN